MWSENPATWVLSGFSTVVAALVVLGVLQVLYFVVSGGIPRTGFYYSRRLRDSNPHVRQDAIKDLVQRADAFALKQLVAALEDREVAIRLAAVEGLGRTKDPAVAESLIRMLGDPELAVRIKATDALAGMPTAEGVQAIIEQLAEADPRYKIAALRVFRDVYAPGALPAIARMTLDLEEQVALAACTVAVQYGDEAIPHLGEVVPDAGEAAERVVKTMLTINDAACVGPLKQAFLRSQNLWSLKECADALINIGAPGTADFFIPHLQNPSHPARLHLVWSLPFLFEPSIVPPLLALLVDPDARIRREAHTSLEKLVSSMGDTRITDPLLAGLASPEREICKYSGLALGQLSTRHVIMRVMRALYGADADATTAFLEGIVGYPMARMITYDEMVLGLDRIMTNNRLSADTMRAVGILESLLIILHGHSLRGQRLDEGSNDLLIKGRRTFYPMSLADLHPAADLVLEYVSSKSEGDRFRMAHAN